MGDDSTKTRTEALEELAVQARVLLETAEGRLSDPSYCGADGAKLTVGEIEHLSEVTEVLSASLLAESSDAAEAVKIRKDLTMRMRRIKITGIVRQVLDLIGATGANRHELLKQHPPSPAGGESAEKITGTKMWQLAEFLGGALERVSGGPGHRFMEHHPNWWLSVELRRASEGLSGDDKKDARAKVYAEYERKKPELRARYVRELKKLHNVIAGQPDDGENKSGHSRGGATEIGIRILEEFWKDKGALRSTVKKDAKQGTRKSGATGKG